MISLIGCAFHTNHEWWENAVILIYFTLHSICLRTVGSRKHVYILLYNNHITEH